MTKYIHEDGKVVISIDVDNIEEEVKDSDGFITKFIYRKKPLLTVDIKIITDYGVIEAHVSGEGEFGIG